MDPCGQVTIGVQGQDITPSANPLFSVLAAAFPVQFRPWNHGNCNGFEALILADQDLGSRLDIATAGLPIFVAPAKPTSPVPSGGAEFRLEKSSALDASLRGLYFKGEAFESAATLPRLAGDDILAFQNTKPMWLRRRTQEADVTIVAWPLPRFDGEEHIYENLQPAKFLRLLPLLQFLRNLTRQADWQSPPMTACLVVDDPNFHSKRYGHLDFRRLVADAREKQFYVSIATVPLDCWWIDRQIRELFRENVPRLSILLHGNNHTYEELARPGSDPERLCLLAEALRRYQRLERLSGMEVCRVMECPHGSLSVAMLEPMARLGFEAALATTAHLLRSNRGTTFPASLGTEPTILERRAVPIIPRIRAEVGWQTEVRLSAFMRQPLILAAHHWDFASQSHLAEEFARIVNGLPNVRWASPTGVARACYQFREIGEVLHLKLGSRTVDVQVPQSVQWLMIHRPWLQGASESELLVVRAQENEFFRAVSSADVVGPIPVQGNAALQVSSSILNGVDCDSVPPPRLRCWPLVRKVMTEIRDRTCLRVNLPRRARHLEKHPQRRGASPRQ